MGRSPVTGTVKSNGEPGRTPTTRAPLMRGLGEGFGCQYDCRLARRVDGFGLALGHHDLGVSPVGMIVVDIVPGIPHAQHQHFDAAEGHGNLFGRVAAAQHAAFPERFAVADHLEDNAPFFTDFVIDARPWR